MLNSYLKNGVTLTDKDSFSKLIVFARADYSD